ncbi:MAG: hypothetical protein KGZ62_06125 [Sulfurimonas sp.]|nr:hypothetical protein [Sulfurimonas sp.]
MSIEGFKNIEAVKPRKLNPNFKNVDLPFPEMLSPSIRSAVTYWFVKFFAILVQIETLARNGNVYIDLCWRQYLPALGIQWSFLPDMMTSNGKIPSGTWWLIYPRHEQFLKDALVRCLGRVCNWCAPSNSNVPTRKFIAPCISYTPRDKYIRTIFQIEYPESDLRSENRGILIA